MHEPAQPVHSCARTLPKEAGFHPGKLLAVGPATNMKSSRVQWYWHRLRAMSCAELKEHVRRKFRQRADAGQLPDWRRFPIIVSRDFPRLPGREEAPELVRASLRREASEILSGHWRAFGHLPLQVDDPPQWQRDYLRGVNVETNQSAFALNHRQLPDGADIKLVWELSRWHQLVHLAQAAFVLDDRRAGDKCIAWLKDWQAHNPPFRGWNWTSALESGIRLIQFTWIDALLRGCCEKATASPWANELDTLSSELLPAHVHFTWRYKSFGSSANNHLLGELAGLIIALAHWPALEKWCAPLAELQTLWEAEVLAQFAGDGGNKEQALSYQLFAWELCWQANMALCAAGQDVAFDVKDRLAAAASFYLETQVRREPWDYGDSDNAFVTPFYSSDATARLEWCHWLENRAGEQALRYWLRLPPASSRPHSRVVNEHAIQSDPWLIYKPSGQAMCELGFWFLRFDLSPLGYLATAAHGHLDALHLSIWFNGVAMIIDPGTGAYFGDEPVRHWLASRDAHNGPNPTGTELARRLGPFLWGDHHPDPTWRTGRDGTSEEQTLSGELLLPGRGLLRRHVAHVVQHDGWDVTDEWQPQSNPPPAFSVRWQFAPGCYVKQLAPRRFQLHRHDVSIIVEADERWAEATLVEDPSAPREHPLAGTVSPAFRQTCFAPYLLLQASPGAQPGAFRTRFLAREPSSPTQPKP